MAKKNKRAVNESSVLFAEESKIKQSGFWSGLGRGERIAAVAVCLLLSMGALGATGFGSKIVSLLTSKDTNAANSSSTGNNGSSVSSLNPFAPPAPPPPSATPQLSKEYIYAGSRMLAVEDANAVAAPPADLAVFRPSNGTWYVMGGQGSTPTTVAWGQNYDIPVPGDFDGDGKTDFSVFRPSGSTGTWYVSNSGSGTTVGLSFGTNDDKVAPADYDGDGKTDIAVYRPNTGYWYIVQSSTNTIVAYQWGVGDHTPISADYDGDGKADIAVWYNSGAAFLILKSTNNYNIYAAQNVPFGQSGDVPVSGDYDGDGKADFALRRGNVWHIKQSSDGATQAITWQLGSDKAVQNDYDGDGKVDIAVWRAAIGWWFIRQSSKIGQVGELREAQWGGVINGVEDIPVPAFYRR